MVEHNFRSEKPSMRSFLRSISAIRFILGVIIIVYQVLAFANDGVTTNARNDGTLSLVDLSRICHSRRDQ